MCGAGRPEDRRDSRLINALFGRACTTSMRKDSVGSLSILPCRTGAALFARGSSAAPDRRRLPIACLSPRGCPPAASAIAATRPQPTKLGKRAICDVHRPASSPGLSFDAACGLGIDTRSVTTTAHASATRRRVGVRARPSQSRCDVGPRQGASDENRPPSEQHFRPYPCG